MAKSLLKNYFMAIVAVVMIVGFSAFKVVEKKNELYYFDINGVYIDNLATICPENETLYHCAFGYSEEFVDILSNPMVLKPTTDPLSDWEDQRFKDTP